VVLRVQEALILHATQHVEAALLGLIGIDEGRIARGRLGQAGQHRSLGDGQVLAVFGEVGLGGFADSVSAVPEIDLVQVEIEDLLLREAFLDVARQDHLPDLATDLPLRG
jgi:hypothetical protein